MTAMIDRELTHSKVWKPVGPIVGGWQPAVKRVYRLNMSNVRGELHFSHFAAGGTALYEFQPIEAAAQQWQRLVKIEDVEEIL